MAVLMNLQTDDGWIELPRQFDDDQQPLPPSTWAVQLWGTPPPYSVGEGAARPISLPYHATADILRLQEIAARLLPSWNFEVREVWAPRAITHDDAMALFRRWGW